MRSLCRWGNSRSPAYGTLSDYQFMRPHSREKRQDRQRTAWGQSLHSVDDVVQVFVRYCKGAAWRCLARDLRLQGHASCRQHAADVAGRHLSGAAPSRAASAGRQPQGHAASCRQAGACAA